MEQMPLDTAAAMLKGVRQGRVICGAYQEPDGDGACPMLLALRHGAPCTYVRFAPVWDYFTGVVTLRGNCKMRLATQEEVDTLCRLLEKRLAKAHPLPAPGMNLQPLQLGDPQPVGTA